MSTEKTITLPAEDGNYVYKPPAGECIPLILERGTWLFTNGRAVCENALELSLLNGATLYRLVAGESKGFDK